MDLKTLRNARLYGGPMGGFQLRKGRELVFVLDELEETITLFHRAAPPSLTSPQEGPEPSTQGEEAFSEHEFHPG